MSDKPVSHDRFRDIGIAFNHRRLRNGETWDLLDYGKQQRRRADNAEAVVVKVREYVAMLVGNNVHPDVAAAADDLRYIVNPPVS